MTRPARKTIGELAAIAQEVQDVIIRHRCSMNDGFSVLASVMAGGLQYRSDPLGALAQITKWICDELDKQEREDTGKSCSEGVGHA